MQVNTISSTDASHRLIHLDILRGFALFGILLANLQWFTRPFQAITLGYDTSISDINLVASWLISWLAEGKFYPLFALLFGIGFTLMSERAVENGVRFWTVYGRRLLFLALLGVLHIVFIWPGDILLLYAVCATGMLVLFRNTPAQRLWKWALVLLGIPWVLIGLLALSSVIDPAAMDDMRTELTQEKAEVINDVQRASSIYESGGYREVTGERIHGYVNYVSTEGMFWLPVMLGYFLLGRWLAVSGRVIDLHAHRRFLQRLATIGFPVGLTLAAFGAALIYQGDIALLDQVALLGVLIAMVAGVVLPLGYMAVVFLAAPKLAWLAPVGRMALSQYLLQSLVWTTVFYGYGLELWSQIPRAGQVVLAIAFFALQVVVSQWWLKRYRFGPVEWLWRCFTYWRWQSFKTLERA